MYNDRNLALNQLIEMSLKDEYALRDMIKEPLVIEDCTRNELEFLKSASALIYYILKEKEIDIPDWIKDSRLEVDGSIYCNSVSY